MLSRAPRSLPRTPIRGPGAGSASTMPTDDAIFIPLCGLHKAMVIPESLPRTRYGAEFLRAGTVPNPEGRGLPLPLLLPSLPSLRARAPYPLSLDGLSGVGKSVQPSMNTNVQPPLPQLLPPLPQGEGWGEGDSPSLRSSALPPLPRRAVRGRQECTAKYEYQRAAPSPSAPTPSPSGRGLG